MQSIPRRNGVSLSAKICDECSRLDPTGNFFWYVMTYISEHGRCPATRERYSNDPELNLVISIWHVYRNL